MKLEDLNKEQHPPGAPGKIARPLVLNAVAGQLDNNCHEKQELEAAEHEEPVAGVRADRLVVELLQRLARVLLTLHLLRVRDDVVVLEEEVLERFDVVAVATPGIARQEELGALLRPGKQSQSKPGSSRVIKQSQSWPGSSRFKTTWPLSARGSAGQVR